MWHNTTARHYLGSLSVQAGLFWYPARILDSTVVTAFSCLLIYLKLALLFCRITSPGSSGIETGTYRPAGSSSSTLRVYLKTTSNCPAVRILYFIIAEFPRSYARLEESNVNIWAPDDTVGSQYCRFRNLWLQIRLRDDAGKSALQMENTSVHSSWKSVI